MRDVWGNRGTGAEAARPLWLAVARPAFLVIAGGAAIAITLREREAIGEAISRADLTFINLALLAALAHVALTWVSWHALFASAQTRLSTSQSARIFFLGQMGKYLPGSIWSYLASAELAKRAGLARSVVLSSLILAVMIGTGSALLVAAATVPGMSNFAISSGWMLLFALPIVALLALPRIRSMIADLLQVAFPLQMKALLGSLAIAVLAWLPAGVMITLAASALGHDIAPPFALQAAGFYALAWVSGFLFFVAPAGVGAREAMLVSLLTARLPLADALLIALLARVLVTLADIALGVSSLLIPPSRVAGASD